MFLPFLKYIKSFEREFAKLFDIFAIFSRICISEMIGFKD